MDKYSTKRPCKKCGHVGTADRFYAKFGVRGYEGTNKIIVDYYGNDVIRRICDNCGVIWEEVPLDELQDRLSKLPGPLAEIILKGRM